MALIYFCFALDDYPDLCIFKSPNVQNGLIYAKPKTSMPINLDAVFTEEEFSTHSIWMKRLVGELFGLIGDTYLRDIATLQVIWPDLNINV